jgi:hypothetical protein
MSPQIEDMDLSCDSAQLPLVVGVLLGVMAVGMLFMQLPMAMRMDIVHAICGMVPGLGGWGV